MVGITACDISSVPRRLTSSTASCCALDIHQLQRLGNPGVIDQYINPTVFRQNLFDGRLHLHFISDVGRRPRWPSPNAAAAVLLASPLRSIMTTFAPFSANNSQSRSPNRVRRPRQ